MKTLFSRLVEDESGLILSAELVLILTIAVLGIVVGLVQVQTAVLSEFQDLSLAFSSMNQSYVTPGFHGCRKFWGPISWTAGSGFIDVFEGCVGGWNGGGGYVGGGGYGGGYSGGYSGGGGYAEIGSGYSSTSSACPPGTVDCPQNVPSQQVPCETCTPGTVVPGGAVLPPSADQPPAPPLEPR